MTEREALEFALALIGDESNRQLNRIIQEERVIAHLRKENVLVWCRERRIDCDQAIMAIQKRLTELAQK